MKKIFKTLFWFLTIAFMLLLVGFGLAHFFKKEIFRTRVLIPYQLLFSMLNAQPEDFRNNLLQKNIPLKIGVNHFEFSFENQYAGEKEIFVLVKGNEKLWNKNDGVKKGYIPNLKVKMKIFLGEKLLWQGENNQCFNPRSFDYKNQFCLGFGIGNIYCPDNIPLDSTLKLVVDIDNHDNDFAAKNSQVELRIINHVGE